VGLVKRGGLYLMVLQKRLPSLRLENGNSLCRVCICVYKLLQLNRDLAVLFVSRNLS
jgi:hypothetical protein